MPNNRWTHTRVYRPRALYQQPLYGKNGLCLSPIGNRKNWTVDLVSGPVSLTEPEGVIYYPVVSAEEMYHQVDALFDACDIFIMCAAVSDFRPLEYKKEEKVKKDQAERSLRLTRTLDILKTMSQRKVAQYIAGVPPRPIT